MEKDIIYLDYSNNRFFIFIFRFSEDCLILLID